MNHSLPAPKVDQSTAEWIRREAERRGEAVEVVVSQLVLRGVAVERGTTQAQTHHDLDALAGTWNDKDLAEFTQATAPFERVDPELWQ